MQLKPLLLAAGLAGAILAAISAAAAPAAGSPVDFNRQIQPLLARNCYACHGPDEKTRMAGLRLDIREGALRDGGRGPGLVPGDSGRSLIYQRIITNDSARRMPPAATGHTLSPQETDLIRRWIDSGAAYARHWAFQAPVRPEVPRESAAAGSSPIDRFIAQKLSAAGLQFSPPADRYSLIRRLSLDLTGLPPSPAEVDAFVRSSDPNAYENLVDRLLASPHYGERWARLWLDLARYADSAGYGSDPLRPDIWPYRDWVIEAFNRNLPYDRFTIEQIAGDLLPNPRPSQIVATAFHRNTMTNTEGGTDDEEFRTAAVKDRIASTAQVWMGLTLGCAQCHSHKFDPISQRDYYRFFAFFNQTEDADRPDEAPTMPFYTPQQQVQREKLESELRALDAQAAVPDARLEAEQAAWEASVRNGQGWNSVVPEQAAATGGIQLSTDASTGLITAAGAAASSLYSVSFRLPAGSRAIRISTPEESEDFILTGVEAAAAPPGGGPRAARYIRIELPGNERILSLAEVEVAGAGGNLAAAGRARQSSTAFGGEASRAIDGRTGGDYDGGSVTHTAAEKDPWWEVDLGAEHPVEAVTLFNRTDHDLGGRLAGARVRLLDAARAEIWSRSLSQPPSPSVRLDLRGLVPIALQSPSAGSAMSGFGPEGLIDANQQSGWRPGPGAHAAVLLLASPPGHDQEVTVTLRQEHPEGKPLRRFRLQTSRDSGPLNALPPGVEAAVRSGTRTAEQQRLIAEFFRPISITGAPIRARQAELRRRLTAIQPAQLPIMRELPAEKHRQTYMLNKGNFLDRGEQVQPGYLEAFHAPPAGWPASRLGVALWLTSRDNPLTARVAVNRFWAALFGTGLVETEEDWGTQGSPPSHPDLLDWLALEFQGRGWNIKALLKEIVMSRTYRQQSRVQARAQRVDPRNRLLSYFPRRRLEAETVRDQALAISGLLSRKIGGPSVFPPQPDGLWRAAFNGQRTWATSAGEDRYRRGLYTFWRRTVPYPSMATFDAPSREICTLRRQPTNTPLQALVTLNDPAFWEMAQALGRRIAREGGGSVEEKAAYALRLALGRPPLPEQVRPLVDLYQLELKRFSAAPAEAQKLATDPLGPLPQSLSAAEAAAWSVVGNVVLNLDGVLTRN